MGRPPSATNAIINLIAGMQVKTEAEADIEQSITITNITGYNCQVSCFEIGSCGYIDLHKKRRIVVYLAQVQETWH